MIHRILLIILLVLMLGGCNPSDLEDQEAAGYSVISVPQKQDGGASDPRAPQQNTIEETSVPPGQPTAVIFYNGTVLTMNDQQPLAEAIALEGNTILAVGDQQSVFAHQNDATVMIDLQDMTLMPGFVDAHSHMFTHYGDSGANLLELQDQILAQGITTMADMGGDTGEVLAELRQLESDGTLQMRVSMYLLRITNCGEDFGTWYLDFPQTLDQQSLVHVPGVKIFTDGGSCNRPARSVGDLGDLYFTQEEIVQLISEADANGYQAAVHALGDRAIEQVLKAIKTVNEGGSNRNRHRIEHNASVRPDLIPLYTESQPVALIFGAFPACFWAGESNQFQFRTSDEYLAWEWPYRSLIEANPVVVFAWHQDVPVFDLGLIKHLWGMVTRKEVAPDGSICEPPDWAVNETVPVDTALKVMTINAAYALLRDDQIGSLEPGKLADLVILSGNPLSVAPDDLINLQVLATVVNGQTVFCADSMSGICP